MSDPTEDNSDTLDNSTEALTLDPAPAPPLFPWPPGPEDNVVVAATEVARRSLFSPTAFFREMPPEGIKSALAYAVPISVIGAALMLFWTSVFDLLGLFSPEEFDPDSSALDRIIEFLMSPVIAVAALFIGAALTHGSLKLLRAAKHPFAATFRVGAFCTSTALFSAVPVLGTWIATIWSIVIYVIGLRETHQTTTGRAIAAILIPAAILLVIGTIFLVIAILVFGIAMTSAIRP